MSRANRLDEAAPHSMTRITFTSGLNGEPEEWDEHAQLSPMGDAVAYVSSRPYGILHDRRYGWWLKTDLWLISPDGTGARRMTFFNEPGWRYSEGRTVVADNAWNPAARENRPQIAIGMYVGRLDEIQVRIADFHRVPTPH